MADTRSVSASQETPPGKGHVLLRALAGFRAGQLNMDAPISLAILLAASLWLIYRIVKGWVYLNEQRAMPY